MSKYDDLPSWVLTLAVLAAIPAIFWNAYALTVLWGWFVVPLGAPAIGKAHAYGLVLLIGMAQRIPQPTDTKSFLHSVVYAYLAPALGLLLGAIAHAWM